LARPPCDRVTDRNTTEHHTETIDPEIAQVIEPIPTAVRREQTYLSSLHDPFPLG
jgi:hypothetical protein